MNKVIYTLLAITLLSGIVLMTNTTSATKSVSNASVSVPEACTMTGSGMNSHTATITPGTFSASTGSDYENGIGKTTFTVICNDYNGFAIYAIGYTGDSYDDTNHTKLVGSNTNAAIDTAVYSSGDTTSSWSMKVNKVTDSTISYLPTNMSIQNSFDSWHTIPDTYTEVAQYKASTGSSTTDTTLGAKIDTTYAAFIAPNQPGDTYIGQVKYTMVHPYNDVPAQPQTSASGKICYYANASNAIGTMGCQDVASTVTLLASNFSRTGYGFAGWSDKFDYAANNEAHFYGPQEDLSISDTSIYTGEGKGLSLYAVWVKSAGSLQDSSKVSQLCGTGTGSLTTAPTDGTADLSSVSALTDQRDNNTYTIAKLADGNCWMIENLRLEAEYTRTADKQTLAQGYGTSATYGNFSGLANAESTGFSSTYSANSLYSNDGSNDTINIGTSDSPAYRMPRYNNWNNQSTSTNRPQNPTTNSATNSTTNAGMYSYGNYYTWHAAIADLTYYGNNNGNGINNSSVTNTSLCPSGWHLPTGGIVYDGVNTTGDTSTFREFYNLSYKTMDEVKTAYEDNPSNGYAYYSSNTTNATGNTATKAFRKFPNNFLYSGLFALSSTSYKGSEGYFLSSTANTYSTSCGLHLTRSVLRPGTYNPSKNYGYSIRCIASDST